MDLPKLLNVSEGLAIDMLNYKKALSKDTIRILAEKFKLSQEAFNKPYKLRAQANAKTKKRRKTSVGRNLAKAS
jgi:HTH-type transcriptional regulator/antitoxin HigA